MDGFPEKETEIMLPGPAGQLQTRVCASRHVPARGVGVICHPHPLYAGTMQNKVVTTVFKAFLQSGYHALRFNYRGVGASDGQFADAIGESDDCLAIINWLRKAEPTLPLVLAGFSFGAFVSARAASLTQPSPAALISIAPAVEHAPFADLAAIACPWVVMIPEADEIVSAPAAIEWLNTRQENITSVNFPNTSHFFHGELVALQEQVCQYLST